MQATIESPTSTPRSHFGSSQFNLSSVNQRGGCKMESSFLFNKVPVVSARCEPPPLTVVPEDAFGKVRKRSNLITSQNRENGVSVQAGMQLTVIRGQNCVVLEMFLAVLRPNVATKGGQKNISKGSRNRLRGASPTPRGRGLRSFELY